MVGDLVVAAPMASADGSDKHSLAKRCAHTLAERLAVLDARWLCEMGDDDAFEEITGELQRDMTRLVLALRSERAQTLNERAAEAERESQRRRQRQLCLQQVRDQAPASKPPFLTAPHFHQKQRKPIYHFH